MRRIEEIAADHPFVQQFWDAFEYLNSIRGTSFQLNHYATTDSQIAINLNEFAAKAAHHSQKLADLNILRQMLRDSRRYKCRDANRSVNSAIRCSPTDLRSATVKCWVFEKNDR